MTSKHVKCHLDVLNNFHCQYSWVSQQGNPREIFSRFPTRKFWHMVFLLETFSWFPSGNLADVMYLFLLFPVKEIHRRFPGLGKAAGLGICHFSWGRKSNNSGSEFPTKLSLCKGRRQHFFIIIAYFRFTSVKAVRGWKFICKDRGEGGGEWHYLYIVKIEIFHPVLTPSLPKWGPKKSEDGAKGD